MTQQWWSATAVPDGVRLAGYTGSFDGRNPNVRVPYQHKKVVDKLHRVDGWKYASGRTFKLFTEDVRHEQPLVTVGDVGAASAAIFIVEVSVRWQTGCGTSDLALLTLHSDGAERGAVLLGSEAG